MSGDLTVYFGGTNVWIIPKDAVVDHSPKPAPQCRSLFRVLNAHIDGLVRCQGGDLGDDHEHSASAAVTHAYGPYRWTTAQEYGRVTPRGEQS